MGGISHIKCPLSQALWKNGLDFVFKIIDYFAQLNWEFRVSRQSFLESCTITLCDVYLFPFVILVTITLLYLEKGVEVDPNRESHYY